MTTDREEDSDIQQSEGIKQETPIGSEVPLAGTCCKVVSGIEEQLNDEMADHA